MVKFILLFAKLRLANHLGPDMIPNKILKIFACELAPGLADVYNKSMVQVGFPRHLKRSIVRPIPKLILPASIENYLRPISLTSQISKVMEGFTLNSLLPQMVNKLDTKQFALPKRSTTQALIYLLHLIHDGLEKGHCSARLCFADFRKCFDLVDHNIGWWTIALVNSKSLISTRLSSDGLEPFLPTESRR